MGVTSESASLTLEERNRWERTFEHIGNWTPYITLLIGLILGILSAIGSPSEAVLTLGLAAVAFAWVLFMFTLAGERRQSQAWMRFYMLGLLAICTVMMFYRPVFFVFVITGFVHSFLLKPALASFTAVALSSLIVNMRIVYPHGGTESWITYLVIVAIQTAAVGIGTLGGERLTELSEQRRVAVRELRMASEENELLQDQLVEQAREAGIDEERRRMAREIHDTIAQGLTGVITQLEAAGQVKDDPAALQRRIDNAIQLARESLSEARRAMSDLLPAPLEEGGLASALKEVTERWSSLSHVPAELTTTGTVRRLHPEVEVTVLRVTQEALANVAKHARASRVGVTLSYMGDTVSVDVRDNGVGIDHAATVNGGSPDSSFGLTAMRQRVEGLSGTLEVESEKGGGTAVSALLPAIAVEREIG